MDAVSALIGVVIGGLLGAGIMAWARRHAHVSSDHGLLIEQRDDLQDRLKTEQEAHAEVRERAAALKAELEGAARLLEQQKTFIDDARKQMAASFAVTGQEALKVNSEQFLQLARETYKPIADLLAAQGEEVKKLEAKRSQAYGEITESIKHVLTSHDTLTKETSRLVSALSRSDQRGRWGEMALRNAVELAGMTEHCDFLEQESASTESGVVRPDMLVRLPGDGLIVVDSKLSLARYMDSLEDDADRDSLLDSHAESVNRHWKDLARKAYWEQFDNTPEVVVMFMPLESALIAALERRPHMHAEAMENRVLIATPTLLVGMLRSVAFGWRQDALAENARRIADVGRELHERISTFVAAYTQVGARLSSAVDAYNKSVGSLESRLMVSSRRLRELGATGADEIDPPTPITRDVREAHALPESDVPE